MRLRDFLEFQKKRAQGTLNFEDIKSKQFDVDFDSDDVSGFPENLDLSAYPNNFAAI